MYPTEDEERILSLEATIARMMAENEAASTRAFEAGLEAAANSVEERARRLLAETGGRSVADTLRVAAMGIRALKPKA